MRRVEYFIIWATFIAINILNLEFGMLIGIGVSMLVFIFEISNSRSISTVSRPSNVMRGFKQRESLACQFGAIVAMQLAGHIFFGSAVAILEEVKRSLLVEKLPTVQEQHSKQHGRPSSDGQNNLRFLGDDAKIVPDNRVASKFLILDLTHVTGLDTTAVRTIFVSLGQLLQQHDMSMVLTNLTPQVSKLLRAHQVISDITHSQGVCTELPTLEDGLQWCEDSLLSRGANSENFRVHMGASLTVFDGLPMILRSYLEGRASDVSLDRAAAYVLHPHPPSLTLNFPP